MLLASLRLAFPEKTIKLARKKLDRLRVRKVDPLKGGPEVTDAQREYAAEKFKNESEYVKQLFEESPIVLGSGSPYTG